MGFCSYVFYQTFYKYQTDVDQILAEIPADDKELPPNVLKVFRNTREINSIKTVTVQNIWGNIFNKNKINGSMGQWHLYGVIWSVLLPLRVGEKEVFSYFANKVYIGNHKASGDIVGFKQAAQFYFKKDWHSLTEEECLVLMVFSYSPEFARNVNSEIFSKKLNNFTETYNKNLHKWAW